MKRKLEYTDYLQDIIYAVEKAEQFVKGIDFDAFKANDEKVFAVIRALEIIGEAAKKLPKRLGTVTQTCPGRISLECVTSLSMNTSV